MYFSNEEKYSSILIKNAKMIATIDEKVDEKYGTLKNSSIYIEKNKIVEINSERNDADKIIDGSDKIVLPGFVNTHHHFFQTLFRNVPKMQNSPMDLWLKTLCNIVEDLDNESVYVSTLTTLAELVLSGCTTTSDHFYLFPHKRHELFDQTIKGAREFGIRFHSCKGSMDLDNKNGGIFPNEFVQDLNEIESESKRVITEFHDKNDFSMCKVSIGPCNIFTSSKEAYEQAINLAEKKEVMTHTHLAETILEEKVSFEKYNKSPVDWMEECGWFTKNTWFAHCVYLNKKEIEKLANLKVGVSTCPSCNSRANGIAPIKEMLEEGVNVGIGVDGSSGNDSSDMLFELRMLRSLQGARDGVFYSYIRKSNDLKIKNYFEEHKINSTYLKPWSALKIGTIGGAKVLGREKEIGSIKEGKAADLILLKTSNKIGFAGAVDKIGSLISCKSYGVEDSIINGRIIVENGRIVGLNLQNLIDKHNEISEKLNSTN